MIIDGQKVSSEIQAAIKLEIDKLGSRRPCLAVIMVGEHPASRVYVKRKMEACERTGMKSIHIELPHTASEEELIQEIDKLNKNPEVNGILVQLPLPEQMDPLRVMMSIHPSKDIDGFHPINVGKLLLGEPSGFVPCTPLGVQTLLEHYEISCSGKHAVIVGRSNIVGKPLAALLMQNTPQGNATVTVLHSRSENLSEFTRSADILIAAIGKPHFIKKEMVKKGAVVIDVGINRVDNKLVGDVDFEAVKDWASFITPVPGGVGPMTIAMLLSNTLKSFRACASSGS